MVAVVCASGPSLTPDDVASVRGRVDCVVVVNTTFRLAPWADHLYACDAKWWDIHIKEVRESFSGQCWTITADCARRLKLKHIENAGRGGLCDKPGKVFNTGNSGGHAIGLAYHLGHKQIILLGYDCQETGGKKHWHGDHPNPLNRPQAFKTWAQRFQLIADDARKLGVEIINSSRATSLSCFSRMPIDEALNRYGLSRPGNADRSDRLCGAATADLVV